MQHEHRLSPELPSSASDRRRRDRGSSLVEIITAIAVMGVGVVAVLSGLRASVSATVIDRDHALAFSWLQAASDAVFLADRVPCTADGSGRTTAITAYDTAVQTATQPSTWVGTDASISVVDVEYLGRTSVDADFEWGRSWCFEGTGYDESPLYTQRVTIEVVLPEGASTETLQLVKSE